MRARLLLARGADHVRRVVHVLLRDELRASVAVVVDRLRHGLVHHRVATLSRMHHHLGLTAHPSLGLVLVRVLEKLEPVTDLAFVEAV